MMSPVPLWTEVAFAAIEDFTHGTAVVDGVMLGIGLAGPGRGADPLDARGRQVRERSRAARRPSGCARRSTASRTRRRRRVRVRHEREGAVRDAVREGPHRHRPPRARRQPQRVPGRPERLLAPPRRRLPQRDDVDRGRRHVHPEGRRVGAARRRRPARRRRADRAARRQLVADARARARRSSLGYSVFTPGTVLAARLPRDRGGRLRRRRLGRASARRRAPSRSREGDALHIPAGVWHAVANTGDEDVVMVFGFPHPDYPPTERR